MTWRVRLAAALGLALVVAGCARKAETPKETPVVPPANAIETETPSATSTTAEEGENLQLTSEAFEDGEAIPARYTADGEDISPDLVWGGSLPEKTKALALIMDDPDAPSGTFTHWVIYDIPTSWTMIEAGTPPQKQLPDSEVKQGKNGFGSIGYKGPAPPPGKPHHYHFTLYALDAPTGLAAGAARDELTKAMEGHIIAQKELVGTYGR